MHQILHDPIYVLTDKSDNTIKPHTIIWKSKHYNITYTHFVRSFSNEEDELLYFSVSSFPTFMTIQLDIKTFEWHLLEIYDDEY